MSVQSLLENGPAQFAPIRPEEVPPVVADLLSTKSSLYVNRPGLSVGGFDELLLVEQNFDVRSFVAREDKTYHNGQTERVFHVVDATSEGDLVGYGELRYALTDPHPYFKDKPLIGDLYTEEQYRRTRRGNLAGRLLVMKAIADRLGFPLYSDTLISASASRVARRLVRAGLAEEVQEGKLTRYRTVV